MIRSLIAPTTIGAAGALALAAAPACAAAAQPDPVDGNCATRTGVPLYVNVTGLKDRTGRLKLEIYPPNEEDFLRDDTSLKRESKPFRRIWAQTPASGPVRLCIRAPGPGTWAVLFTHDRDGKNKFNFWEDGAGFPSNQKLGRSRPKVRQALVNVGPGGGQITIKAQYLRGLGGFAPLDDWGAGTMRIVDVNEFYSPTGGGVRTYLDRKMGIMADMGHELTVIAPALESSVEERPGGGRIFWVKAPPLILDRNYGIFVHDEPVWKLLDMLRPDIVETSSPWLPAWTVARWQGDAVKVFFAHGDNIGAYPQRWLDSVATPIQVERAFAWYTRYMSRFLEHYDAFVTNGPALAKRFRRRGMHVHASMPLGIERQWFSPDLRDEKLRVALLAQLGLPPEGHLLLGLGRHHKEKRWPLVIDAVEAAANDLPVGLMLIGDGPQRRQLEARIAGSPHIKIFRPVYDRVRFSRIMASCDALIHGSDAEPFGLVASEALASGLPLIGPDEGGFAELADPLFAETYRARDAYSAAGAIRRMFGREQAILRNAARVAAGKVRSDADHAAELMAYYEGLLEARRGGAGVRAAGSA